MIEALKRRAYEWFEDSIHKIKTGESTIRCFDGHDWHKVYLHSSGYSRVNMSEVLRSKRVQEELKALGEIARQQMRKNETNH